MSLNHRIQHYQQRVSVLRKRLPVLFPLISKFLVVFVLSLFLTEAADAYECWKVRKSGEEMKDADVVFTGKVIKTEPLPPEKEELDTDRLQVTFKLEKVWKGIASGVAEVTTDTESFYEYTFDLDKSYLVFGYRMYPERISMVGCPRVKLVDDAKREIADLGTGYVVVSASAAKASPAPAPVAAQPGVALPLGAKTLPPLPSQLGLPGAPVQAPAPTGQPPIDPGSLKLPTLPSLPDEILKGGSPTGTLPPVLPKTGEAPKAPDGADSKKDFGIPELPKGIGFDENAPPPALPSN